MKTKRSTQLSETRVKREEYHHSWWKVPSHRPEHNHAASLSQQEPISVKGWQALGIQNKNCEKFGSSILTTIVVSLDLTADEQKQHVSDEQEPAVCLNHKPKQQNYVLIEWPFQVWRQQLKRLSSIPTTTDHWCCLWRWRNQKVLLQSGKHKQRWVYWSEKQISTDRSAELQQEDEFLKQQWQGDNQHAVCQQERKNRSKLNQPIHAGSKDKRPA